MSPTPRKPAAGLWLAVNGLALATALILLSLLLTPASGVVFSSAGDDVALGVAGGRALRIDADAAVSVTSSAGTVSAPAREWVADFTPDGLKEPVGRWYARQDRAGELLRAGDARLSAPAIAPIPLRMRPRTLPVVPLDTWLLLALGASTGVLGWWIRSVRPRELTASLFAAACWAVTLTAFSGAAYDGRDIGGSGGWLWALQTANCVGACLSSAALSAFQASHPRRLLPTPALVAWMATGALTGGAVGLGLAPLPVTYLWLLLQAGVLAGLLALQWRSAQSAADRAVLRYVGAVTAAGASSLAVFMAGPVLWGWPSLASDGAAIAPVLTVYGGVAFGLGRARVFELEAWSYRIAAGAAASLAMLVADAVLILGLSLSPPAATALVILAAGFLYLPARSGLVGRLLRTSEPAGSDLVRGLSALAFAPSPAERDARWAALLREIFRPLEIAPSSGRSDKVVLHDAGHQLDLPAISDLPAVSLRHRSSGRRLFTDLDLNTARELIVLLREADAQREIFQAAMLEERERIARDLHDDVNARLLTSLHRADVSLMRSDVRKAMEDIRSLFADRPGDAAPLHQVLADLRFEAMERLQAGGLRVHWPHPEENAALLSGRAARALASASREVVSNVLRHSAARTVTVRVETTATHVHVVLADDGGPHAAPGELPSSGGGLRNVRRRMQQIDGSASIRATGEGVEAALHLPFDAPPKPPAGRAG